MGLKKFFLVGTKLLLLPCIYILRFTFSLFRRNNNLWIFGSWGGDTFSDNTKYLFLHIVENHKNIECFWVTRNKKVFEDLLNLNLPVVYLFSLKGIVTCIRAGKQLTTHSLYDISPTLTKGAVHYCLFHATFPLKKMEFGYLKNTWKKKILLLIHKPFAFDKPDYSICSSDVTSSVIQSALGLDRSKIFKTGYPRSTYINKDIYLETDKLIIEKVCNFDEFKNLIYFVPTFRDDKNFDWFAFGFNRKKLIHFLEMTDSVLVFRFHPFELSKIESKQKFKHERIIFESHSISDPYPLLLNASVLITDYSSIFADFLLLNRPLIFSNFDHLNYIKNERSLYWNYNDVTPGYKASDWDSLIKALNKILVNNEDLHKAERSFMIKKIYQQPIEDILDNVTEAVSSNH